ncbi:MAG TPA: hypothetical protein VJN89_14160 [Candidatus Acidoferrum sp.]|nr:hypothetical protein [Candidatus Acidoferrum sp.]
MPAVGLLLFALEAWESNRDSQFQPSPRRYYWWSFIQLDSDPLNRRPHPQDQGWDLPYKIVDPGYLANFIYLSGLPAFAASALVLRALSRLGVSQALTFFISAPILLFTWYYFLGWLLDRWRRKTPREVVNT